MTAAFAVVIPARNEAASLPRVIAELRECRPDSAIVVVDDCSEDDTPRILRRLDVQWLRLEQHLGIGGAVRAGIRFARELGHDVVVRVDGDGQHRPTDIARLLARLSSADAAQGVRSANGAGYQARTATRLSQRVLASVLANITEQPVTDPTSGFWAFGPQAVHLLADHHPSGYPEPELRLLLHRNGLRVVEQPISMRPRLAGRSSLTPRRMSLAVARLLLTTVVAPLRPVVRRAAPLEVSR